ncbi:MAG: hypothetical protein AAF598_01290, partial [Bacteroidota bacterium]
CTFRLTNSKLMLENWTQAIDPYDFLPKKSTIDPFGAAILPWKEQQKDLPEGNIVLIGLDSVVANPVRKALYRLSASSSNLPFIDLGNARGTKMDILRPLLAECYLGQLTPVLIGSKEDLAMAQVMSFKAFQKPINLSYIGERIPLKGVNEKKPQFLDQALKASQGTVFNTSLMAFQSHYCDPTHLDYLQERHADLLRLGRLKKQIDLAEPLLRDADSLVFNLNAIRYADFPSQFLASPNGLDAELACQLAYFAGLSDKIQSAGFYGFKRKNTARELELSANLVAQMIWYFTNGFANRFGDDPAKDAEQFTKYMVDVKGHHRPLVFLKSKLSERWWLQIQGETDGAQYWVPCLYEDYLLGGQGELSDRYFSALNRFS